MVERRSGHGVSFYHAVRPLCAAGEFFRVHDTITLHDQYQRVELLEIAFQEDIGDRRFIPHIQLYEFEAFVLANPANLEYEYFDHADVIEHLQYALEEKDRSSERSKM